MTSKWQDDGMPKRSSKPKDSKREDVNQIAHRILLEATGEAEKTGPRASAKEPTPEELAHAAAVALGRLGGLKGGKARAAALSKKKRAEIAKRAAKARWAKG